MGVYDMIEVPCPKCGEIEYAQSKGAWSPEMHTFTLDNCPNDVLSNVNRHAPFYCANCDIYFSVKFMNIVPVVKEEK